MRIFLSTLACLFFALPAWSETSIEPLMNKVTVQLNAEQWVTTKTALVIVTINASINEIGMDKIQSQVITKLNNISKGDWHLVSFNRSLDKSGLENIQIAAQARLQNSELSGLREKAKKISKPGETYTINDIQFTPTEDEMRDANNKLRENIYEQIKVEIARVNKFYPDQKYYLHDVNFVSGVYPAPMTQTAMYKLSESASVPMANAALPVGDKLRLSATVVLAASPDPNLAKFVHD